MALIFQWVRLCDRTTQQQASIMEHFLKLVTQLLLLAEKHLDWTQMLT